MRRIHPALAVVLEPFLVIGRLVGADALGHAAARDWLQRFHFAQQRRNELRGIALQGHPGGEVGVEHLRVDVRVNQAVRHRHAVAAGGNFRKARAHRQQAVAAVEGVGGRRHGVIAEAHAHVQRMIARESAQALQRGAGRRVQQLGQAHQLGLRAHRAPAEEQPRTFGADQQARRLAQGLGVLLRGGDGLLEGRHLVHLAEEVADVVRQLDEYRSRLAAGGDAVGLVQGGNHLGMAADAERGLGDRLEQGMLVDVVQLVAVGAVAVDAAGNDQHRNAVQPGLADAAGRVGDARRRHDHQRADAVAGAAHRIGHERRAAFVGDQHRLNLLRGVQLVVQLGVVHAGNAEGETHAQLFQGKTRQCRAGLLHVLLLVDRCCSELL